MSFSLGLAAIVAATVIAVCGSIAGIALGQLARARLELLVHFATGALLGITAFDILPEAKAVLSWPAFLVAGFGGYLLLWVVGKFVFYVCPSCAIAHIDEDQAMARRGSLALLAAALGVHCVLDGVAVVAGGDLSRHAEIGMLFAVGVHKLPEGLALGILLAGARYGKRKALTIAAGIESLTVAGGLASLTLTNAPTPGAIGVVLAIVGGGFVYLVTNALGGAFTHQMQVPFRRGFTVEALSFALTGALFWAAGRF